MTLSRSLTQHNRKRLRRDSESQTDCPPQPSAKRQQLQGDQRQRTPPSFWDNLSRQWLTTRTLGEWNRRTALAAASDLPPRVDQEDWDLKRFARQGGPDLSEVRGVSAVFLPYQLSLLI